MSKKYKLRYLPIFYDDVESAVRYISINLHNPQAAERFLNNVESTVLSLQSNPTIAPIYKTLKSREYPYYWTSVGSYMIFYVVIDDIVEIRRMIYGPRDVSQLLP
jgi:plasmid stabilization system protein ParE